MSIACVCIAVSGVLRLDYIGTMLSGKHGGLEVSHKRAGEVVIALCEVIGVDRQEDTKK